MNWYLLLSQETIGRQLTDGWVQTNRAKLLHNPGAGGGGQVVCHRRWVGTPKLPFFQVVSKQDLYLDVSSNGGTPKSSILIGFSTITIHFGVPLFLETPIFFRAKMDTWHMHVFFLAVNSLEKFLLICLSLPETKQNGWKMKCPNSCIQCRCFFSLVRFVSVLHDIVVHVFLFGMPCFRCFCSSFSGTLNEVLAG